METRSERVAGKWEVPGVTVNFQTPVTPDTNPAGGDVITQNRYRAYIRIKVTVVLEDIEIPIDLEDP
jgi:hypothetical protein